MIGSGVVHHHGIGIGCTKLEVFKLGWQLDKESNGLWYFLLVG
jgi:hypothetical protein